MDMTDPAPDRPETQASQSPQHQPGASSDGLLAVAANLSRYHREHEKYYSEAPLADAIALQRTARTFIALAERWTTAGPAAAPAASPFAGTPDLNDDRAIETSGVLFMEGAGEPAEITRIKSDLRGHRRQRRAERRVASIGDGGLVGHGRSTAGLSRARRPLGRTAQDHRRQLAERRHRPAHRPLPPPRRRHPGTSSTSRRPPCAKTSPVPAPRRPTCSRRPS